MDTQQFLDSVKNADITPKMYKAINTQTARYFEKSNEYVIDFELYDSINGYKTFTDFEKAVIAYRANERLSENFYLDGFLSYWEHKVKLSHQPKPYNMVFIERVINSCESENQLKNTEQWVLKVADEQYKNGLLNKCVSKITSIKEKTNGK